MFHQLHRTDPGEEFGDRGKPENRGTGVTRLLGFQIAVAVALEQQRLSVLHHQHRRAGHIAALELQGNDAVKESLQVIFVKKMCGNGRHRCDGLGADAVASAWPARIPASEITDTATNKAVVEVISAGCMRSAPKTGAELIRKRVRQGDRNRIHGRGRWSAVLHH